MTTVLILISLAAVVAWIIYDIIKDDATDRQIDELDREIRELEKRIRERQRNRR
jgi:hypothetical protein